MGKKLDCEEAGEREEGEGGLHGCGGARGAVLTLLYMRFEGWWLDLEEESCGVADT